MIVHPAMDSTRAFEEPYLQCFMYLTPSVVYRYSAMEILLIDHLRLLGVKMMYVPITFLLAIRYVREQYAVLTFRQ
jgi:hypothetical protein